MERIAENECGGVAKASWLVEVGRLWVVGRLILTTIMWLNQIPSLLSSLALCKERVWPGAHVQIWVLVIGLLPTVAKVKLLCALCCWFLRVTVVFCSPPQSHVLLLQSEVGTAVWVASGRSGCLFPFQVSFLAALLCLFVLYNPLLTLLSSQCDVVWIVS